MISARVRLGASNSQWHDCQIEDDVPFRSDILIAKAAVEAWWRATANYVAAYDTSHPGRVTDVHRINDVFFCMVDGGLTPVALDLSQAGGPW